MSESLILDLSRFEIQFGSFDPVEIIIQDHLPITSTPLLKCKNNTNEMVDSVDSAEEGWTLVTRKRKGKSKSHHPQIIRYKQKFIKSNRKKQWKKKKVQRAVSTTVAETFIQPQRTSITLWEFFPKSWQNDDQFNLDIVECHVANVEEPTKERVESSSTLMQAPEELNFGTCGDTSVVGVQNLTFSDEDLLLGSTPHNRPLFIAGYTREQRLNRMLVDGGSAVNILPLRVMKELGISMDELSHSRFMIQGFNQGGQRAIGVIRLNLLIDDMTSTALFHVIDARTSYNMLLGRPWIHENGVVPSTLHQCLKYCRDNEVRKVVADERPFTEAESHFADAKFYLARIVVEELQPIGTSSTNKLQRSDSPRDDKSGKIADHKKGISKPIKSGDEKCNVEASKNTTPVLRYVPKVRRVDNQALNGLTLPITNINQTKVATPISGFVRPTQSPKVEHGDLPSTRTEEGFDPNAYKLLAKAGYDPNESSTLGKLPPEANGQDVHGLNSTQKMLRQKGYAVQNSRASLGFTSPAPARIVIKKSANYITAEEDESPNPVKPSVFDRLEEVNPQTSAADCLKEVNSRVSVFDRLGETKSKGSVFDRLGAENLASNEVIMTSAPRESVKNRLGIPKKTIEKKEKINVILEDPKDLRSKIPSRMKRHTTLIVTADEELKVKRQTVVVTKFSAETSQAFPEEENIEYSFHISASDGETQVEEEAEDAPPELEEGVKSTVDNLKEINLGTPEDPRPIYVSALLSPKEEKAYVELLTEYKDVFA